MKAVFVSADLSEAAGPLADLEFPARYRVIRFYCDGRSALPRGGTVLHSKHFSEPDERWSVAARPSP
jgi:hypothetical protein